MPSFWTRAIIVKIERVSLFCAKMKQWTLTFNSLELRIGKRQQRNEFTLKTTYNIRNSYLVLLPILNDADTGKKKICFTIVWKRRNKRIEKKEKKRKQQFFANFFVVISLFLWSSVFTHWYANATFQHWFP